MSHVPDEHSLQTLNKEVASAMNLLKLLSKTTKSHLVGKSQRLPVEELQLAVGLAFFDAAKIGLLASGLTGHGFLIRKAPNTASGWTAPLLFDMMSIGLGATVGFSRVHSLMVLDNEHAVHSFLKTQFTLDSEISVTGGQVGREMHASELNLSHPSDTFSSASYSVAQGAMVDVSFQGVKITVNKDAVHKLYGKDVDNEQVLSGNTPQIPLVEPLLAEIQQLIKGV